jgi:class 3 adenylate cyclase
MNGYAKKASQVLPRELAAWINGIHYTVTESVKSFDGVPVKYVGDGFLSFFSGTGHSERALEAAKEAKKLLAMSDLIILLHRGDIFLGTIGHPDYERPDIMGETVNTAFLAMPWVAKNCKSGIGITDALVEELDCKGDFVKRGKATITGSSDIRIYEPKIS